MLTPDHISVIVPVYNGGKNWSRVLDALQALDPPPGEILIVDDGSTDKSRYLAEQRGLRVVSTTTPRGGPAVARNAGAAIAQGNVLFFLDADVLVYPDAVQRVADAMQDDPVSAIFGTYDDTPDDLSFVSQYKNLLHHHVHQTSSVEATSFWAGCGAIRRDMFRQLDGFSTSYTRPLIEDIELGYRVATSGGKIRLVKDLQVKHLKRWTVLSLLVTDIRDRALPWAALIVHRGKLPADLNLKLTHRVSALLCWLLILCLVAAFLVPLFWLGVLGLMVALVVLNFDLYAFFMRKRGPLFMVGAIALHWLYYLYSSAAFGSVLLANAVRERRFPHVRATASNPHA